MTEESTFKLSVFGYQLDFHLPAGTSRGTYTNRKVWYVLLTSKTNPDRWGVGECAPLPDLSCDALPDYEKILTGACKQTEKTGKPDLDSLRSYPSVLFGIETALRHYTAGSFSLWDTPFSRGEAGIPINGLIWMGNYRYMLDQIENKLASGFRCIKLKIGAIRFDEEIALLRHIRNHFSVNELELRVDANGAFPAADALEKLNRLAEWDIHSIEQPIRAGQWEEMAKLAACSPIPLALDEELIGWNRPEEKRMLLDSIKPRYIILKPSLHGGMAGCNEWIEEAGKRKTGWWVTSALESNIGLNAIAQWYASLPQHTGQNDSNMICQGLGTGGLFTNNIDMPVSVRHDKLWFSPGEEQTAGYRNYFSFLKEWFDPSDHIEVKTSGSTGTPKLLAVKKEKMTYSAVQTCSYLNIRKGDTALLCMDLQYIGAKMMVVRALTGGLSLVVREASGHPLKNMEKSIRFTAMTPLQVHNTLQIPSEKECLSKIDILLIGGSAIHPDLEKELRSFPNRIYATYGMTETMSHIALRRLNGAKASLFYTPFPFVKLSLSPEQTLVIDVPLLCDEPLVTNDLAEIQTDGSFRITGRKDNMINTGGIKVQIENLEEKLTGILAVPFAITSVPDPKFGEAIVLLTEEKRDPEMIRQQILPFLSGYEYPKYILPMDKIPLTPNGKINRAACKEAAAHAQKSRT